jgi:hypothetical protein
MAYELDVDRDTLLEKIVEDVLMRKNSFNLPLDWAREAFRQAYFSYHTVAFLRRLNLGDLASLVLSVHDQLDRKSKS